MGRFTHCARGLVLGGGFRRVVVGLEVRRHHDAAMAVLLFCGGFHWQWSVRCAALHIRELSGAPFVVVVRFGILDGFAFMMFKAFYDVI